MIDKLLSAPNTSEPCVARDATVEYVSKVLAVDSRSEFQNIDLKGKLYDLNVSRFAIGRV